VLNGVTLSIVFAIFTTKSIFATFLVTAGMFAGQPLPLSAPALRPEALTR
jgi:FtsH-binding integral membrane protein